MSIFRLSNLLFFLIAVIIPSAIGFFGFVLDGYILGPYFLGLMCLHLIMDILVWMPLWTHLSLKEKEKFAAKD